ncbi:DUF349 domain-containing protein [Gordonia jinhuaensis]|uniref:DUF349 domain-containing protein n=1 Tax=Gordonia jinhuaensis TaxID=1517702 RepID=A0A916T2Q5_9ACTN|nr:DUF349 domain-containing protein [Gordonia jinhuaensis]GGB26097.1 hypothetical protein GCM10011489_12790 [Gordonia jinhuaensis]
MTGEQTTPGAHEPDSAASPGSPAAPESSVAPESPATAPASEASPAAPAATPKPGPKPGPRPGAPKPGPKPGAHPAPVAAADPTPARPASDPTAFGRIDDDGVVWLITPEGEHQVGSWQAGTVAEGLAHFGRRYDDLATEVEILEERLEAGSGDPRKTKSAAQAVLDGLPTAAVIGDVAALEAKLRALVDGADSTAAEQNKRREQARAAAIARKETLAAEAEQIGAESTQWKVAGDRLRAILDEWKTIKGVDRKTDDVLWKRYSRARDAFNRRRGAHFAELDRERAGAKARKEELIVAAEELSDSTDWAATSARFRELLAEWKAAGRAPRDTDDALWARFKAAQDVFFAARKAANNEQNAEFTANGEAKEELLAEAERTIDPDSDLDAARRAFGEIRDRWDAIGKVPREKMASLESRIRALEKRIRDAEEARWHRTDPAAKARAEQFASRVEQLEEQADKAEASGKTKEAAKLREQAVQWREWARAAESAISDR